MRITVFEYTMYLLARGVRKINLQPPTILIANQSPRPPTFINRRLAFVIRDNRKYFLQYMQHAI